MWPNNSTIGHIPWENHNSKRHMYPSVHCSTVYSSQDMETIQVSTDRWMDKDVVHIYNRILATIRNETGSSVEMWMDLESIIQSEVSHKGKNSGILTQECGV